MSTDISPILNDWPYEPGQITVRKIMGLDEKEKIQMRLELGLLQLETEGRPDGKRPHGKESLLEYHLSQVEEMKAKEGADAHFQLDTEACAELQSEGIQYYYRYLCFFALEDFERAERDTARNLRLFDFVWKYAVEERDKWASEQYRPYLIMMNARARASIKLRQKEYDEALREINAGIEKIESFFAEHQDVTFVGGSGELKFLKAWANEISSSKPPTLEEQLHAELQEALDEEDYERAAKLRDELRRIEG